MLGWRPAAVADGTRFEAEVGYGLRSALDRDAARKYRKQPFTTQADRLRPRLDSRRLPVAGLAVRRAADRGHPGPVIPFGFPASPPMTLYMEGDRMRSFAYPSILRGGHARS